MTCATSRLALTSETEKCRHYIYPVPDPIWIWICTLQGPFLAIFAMELGEPNANMKTILFEKNSLYGLTVPILKYFKNWLKHISVLTAYVCVCVCVWWGGGGGGGGSPL